MQIKGKLCEDLGLKYPIFQGGMAYISTAELAAAVSNAGGLGLICSSRSGGGGNSPLPTAFGTRPGFWC